MTSPAQPKLKPALSFEERMKLFVKPQSPRQPARGFFRDIRPEKARPQVQAEVPLTPEAQPKPVQASLKESYERIQQELYQVYKRKKRQVPRTPADQMVFVQSYKDIVEQLKVIYAQGTGEQPPLSEARWQKCYVETIAMFQTFYGSAQQSPEALTLIKLLYYQFYTQARKKQPQSPPKEAQVSSPVLVQAQNPPPIDPKRIPAAAQPAQPGMAKSEQPIARSEAGPPDLSNYRRWTPQEQQRLQQLKQASHAKPPSSNVQPHVSPPSAQSQPMPQNPPPIVPSQNPAQMSMVPESNAQANAVRRDDFRPAQPPYQRDRQQSWDPRASRREYLLRERLFLERELQRSLGNADALNERWQLWRTHKTQLERDKALVPVKEVFSLVTRRLIRIPFPSAARHISFREQRLHQEATWLQQQAIAINTRYNTLLQEIQLINTELEMLHF